MGLGPGNDFYPINIFTTNYNYLRTKKISISYNIKFFLLRKVNPMNNFFNEFNHMIKNKSVNVELFF